MASVQIHTSGADVQTLESMSCAPASQATLLWVNSHVKRRLKACALNVSNKENSPAFCTALIPAEPCEHTVRVKGQHSAMTEKNGGCAWKRPTLPSWPALRLA